MNLKEQLDVLLDATAFDSTGAKVGAVRQVYVDDASGKITFATVSTGIFSADAIVPLHGARLLDDELHVDHTRDVIRDSPRPDNTEDSLTPEQEFKLLEYYGLEAPAADRGAAGPRSGPSPAPKSEAEPRPGSGGAKSAKDEPRTGAGEDRTDKSSVKGGKNTPGEPASTKPDAAQGSPAQPDAGESESSPAKKKSPEKRQAQESASPTESPSRPVGPAGGRKTAAPAATSGEKADRETADVEKKKEKKATTTTSTNSSSPTEPPAANSSTRADRPGSTEPDTATTGDAGKGASSERG